MTECKYDYSVGQKFGSLIIKAGPDADGVFSCECANCREYYELNRKRLVEKKRNDSQYCKKCRPGSNGYMNNKKPPPDHGLHELTKQFLSGKL